MKKIIGLARRIFLGVEQPCAYQLFLSLSWLHGLAPFACLPSMQSSLPMLNYHLIQILLAAIMPAPRHLAH